MIRIGSKVTVRAERTKRVGRVFDISVGAVTHIRLYSVEFSHNGNLSLGFYYADEIEEVHE